ncbi:CDP-glycerol glycerophosphotransferase family protein [Virgibacillus halodenitrificans]|uniref:CDP-glycerol glycerophosphotransferase family protein n=1 Tax=Virgibacillus halodenitrificans TaxID=1482 RepID=UPI001F4802F9|nr:CDP-glycerol glycerophosphotransferase family protein [Virgibacillus halodenitrificans]MCG1028141.1 CDP-glycerol glycerophosphotransferase family protein [Virgibacillus halodenitrificans]
MKSKWNRVFKKIKNKLVKKVMIFNYTVEKDFMCYEMKLSNFRSLRKNVNPILILNDTEYKLPYTLSGSTLKVYVSKKLLGRLEERATLKIYINKQKMWLKHTEEVEGKLEGLVIDNNYIYSSINKNIIFKNLFKDYSFSNRKIYLNKIQSRYSSLNFSIDRNINTETEQPLEIVALNKKKLHLLEAEYDQRNKQYHVDDFMGLTSGQWLLFINLDNHLLPIQLPTSYQGLAFSTYTHEISMVTSNELTYFFLVEHKFKADNLSVNEKAEDIQIEFNVANPAAVEKEATYELLINDTKNNEDVAIPMKIVDSKLYTDIPIFDLVHEFNNKRFFIRENTKEPKKYRFELQSEITGERAHSEIEYGSELLKIRFYIRKDTSLGLKIKRPKLKKYINDINDFQLSGVVKGLERFVNCKPYFLVEERQSQDTVKIRVGSYFEIDLNNINLISLKSKEKTILDFFILVEAENGDIVRKEKLKYIHADYKKDNYYDYKIVDDNENNQHHFLITTTPFHNLKLETFIIPAHIHIPEDLTLKDMNTWLIGERYNTAQDNGIVLFKWIYNNTDVDIYYVIEEDAEDFEHIKSHPNVLTFGSPKHYEIAFKAKVLLGTHDLENILPYKPARGFFGYEHTYKVFLQHGVLGRKNVEYHKKYYDIPFDLFIVSSDPEKYDIVVNQLGYLENEVEVTGLARFDNLLQKKEPRDILLMPTWRDWINTDEQFLASEYYVAYMNLITNERLLQLLEKYQINLNFYPHYRAQSYFNADMNLGTDRIQFIPLGSKSVQKLLIEHALLITDYSTVSFDFTIMDKPVIFYHFDVKRFFRKGILRPVEETFLGRIAHSEEEIIDIIEERLKNNLDSFHVETSGIIKYKDQQNSERIYKRIINGASQIERENNENN